MNFVIQTMVFVYVGGLGMMSTARVKSARIYLLSEVVPILDQDKERAYDPYFLATYMAGSFLFSFSRGSEISLPVKTLTPLASSGVFFLNQYYVPDLLLKSFYEDKQPTKCVNFAIMGAFAGAVSCAFIGLLTSNPFYPIDGALYGGTNSYLLCMMPDTRLSSF